MVSQKDIASLVGVSQKTVSLYFRNPEKIAPETRKKIQDAIAREKYFPNLAAQTMRNRRFNRIACVAPQYGAGELFAQSHLLAYLNGAGMELANAHYSLIYVPVFLYGSKVPVEYPEFFSSISADGVIGIPGVGMPAEIDDKIRELGLPAIWLNRPAEENIMTIEYDEQTGIDQLVDYLKKQKIRTCGWFGPDMHESTAHYSARQRYEGFRNALAKAGIGLQHSCFCKWGDSLFDASRNYIAEISSDVPDLTLCYSCEYWNFLLQNILNSGDKNISRMKLEYFASAHHYHFQQEMKTNQIRIPEQEMGRRGARAILGVLAGEDFDTFSKPMPTMFSEYIPQK